jgi:hypothetical protein
VKDDSELVGRKERGEKVAAGFSDLLDDRRRFRLVIFVLFLFGFVSGRFPLRAELKDRFEVGDAEQLHLVGLTHVEVADKFLAKRNEHKLLVKNECYVDNEVKENNHLGFQKIIVLIDTFRLSFT